MYRLLALLLLISQRGVTSIAIGEIDDQKLWAEGDSRELARQRASNISDLHYRLSFDLVPGAARIKGREEIGLKLNPGPDPVILDFRDIDPQGRVIEGAISDVK